LSEFNSESERSNTKLETEQQNIKKHKSSKINNNNIPVPNIGS